MRGLLAACGVVALACTPTSEPSPNELHQVVEIHEGVDITEFLDKQPPASADALILDSMPPPFIVKVSVDSGSARALQTSVTFEDGSSLRKTWQVTPANDSGRAVAIFGFDRKPRTISTFVIPGGVEGPGRRGDHRAFHPPRSLDSRSG